MLGKNTVTAKDILDLKCSRLKRPLLPTLFEFELPPFPTMTPYRTGSLTELTSYWKPDVSDKERSFSNRFELARPYEVYVAQLLWNVGLTPFLDSAVDVSQHPERNVILKADQADISVAGKLIEVKSFNNFQYRTVEIDGEPYVFMCNAKNYDKQKTPRDYYVLVCKSSLQEEIENWDAFRQLKVEEYKPFVVPVDRAKFVEYEWTDTERGTETGIFVRKADLIAFESFVWELRQHHNQMKKQSRKLDTQQVVRLFYPHLKTLDELMALHPTLTEAQVKQLYAGQDDGSEFAWRVAREQEMLELDAKRMFDF